MFANIFLLVCSSLFYLGASEECSREFPIPSIPRLQSATFSSDGSYITAVFDSEVSANAVIGATSSFTCGLLFTFPGASLSATCQFTSGTTAVAYLNGASFVKVNDFFAIRGGTITAKCPATYPACVCAAFEAVPDGSVEIQSPAVVTTPVVIMPAAISSSVCAPPSIDLSMSYGSGGRNWESKSVSVTTTSATGGALQTFLQDSSFLSKSVVISSESVTLLESGASYTVIVELCNFLGGCSQGTTVLTVQSEPLPYVSIIGPTATTVNVFSALKIDATASLPLCDNSFVPIADLEFQWTVTLNGALVDVTQTSRDKTRFNLPAYSLQSGLTYVVIVKVTNSKQTTQTSSTSVLVTVTAGSVVAVMAGEASRLLPFDGSLTLNGLGSYDKNIGLTANDNLVYTWTCAQTAPTALASCPTLSMDQSTRGVVTVANTATVYAAYAFTITMTVADTNNNTRAATKVVSLALLAPAAPLVVVTNPSTLAKMNPQQSLRLNGVIELLSTETMTWSVDDALLQAQLVTGNVMLTTRSKSLTTGTHSVAFVLKPDVLTRGTTYLFTLTCGTSKAAVTVKVNDPPRPGTFTIDPPTGTEISTPFEFSTQFWTDEDTPLEFEFGFVSNGVRLVLQPRSRLTSLVTNLPSGKDTDNFVLSAYVRVFDSLNAVQEMVKSVTVTKATSTNDLLDGLEGTVSSAGTVSGLKKALSLVTSVINSKECVDAPDCADLNRGDCGSTADTCGSCLDGFFGDAGDQNSLCINATELNAVLHLDDFTCNSEKACADWHTCVNNVCVPDSKECIGDCSGPNGNCEFIHSKTGFTLSSCPLYDFQCAAQCKCNEGFFGPDCSTAESLLTQRSSLRTDVLDGLQEVANSDNPSADAALSLIASLSAATDQASEVSTDAASTALTVANEILNGGQLGELTTDQISGLLSSLNAVLVSSGLTADARRRRLTVSAMRKDVVSSLDDYGLVLGDNHLVAGQQSVSAEMSSFRTTAQVFGAGSDILASLASSYDSATGAIGTSVALEATESDGELLMVVTSIGSNLYPDIDRDMSSDGVRMAARGANVSKVFTFTIQHNGQITYPVNKSDVFFTTECSSSKQVVDFVCADNYVIVHSCNDSASTLTSRCPGKKTVSVCQNLEDTTDLDTCEVVSFTSTETTCKCEMKPSGRRRRVLRGLEVSEEDIGYLEIGAMTEVVGEDFAGTLYEAKNFDSVNDLQRVLTVIIMFGVMWVVGLGMTWYYAVRGATKDRKVELNEQLNLQRKIAAASTKTSIDKIKKYLDAYVNEVFPVVFRPSPWHERLITEIKKHHRYMNIFTGGGNPRARLMTTVHLLTIQTMLMFILAVFYDIQFPTDDGSCEKLGESACEDEKSLFDQEKSKCSWDSGDGVCEFIEPRISEQMIVLISIVVAVATAPINLVVDFIFDDILAAPTADSVKLNAEPNAIQRAGKQLNAARRASVNAVRRASVSLQAAVAPRRRQSSKLMNTTTTRVIPESTISAQSLANASVSEALGVFKESHQKYEHERNTILGNATSKSMINVSRRTRVVRNGEATRAPTIVNTATVPGIGMLGNSVDARFAELSKEIIAQRRRLKPSEQEDFDNRWGFDPNGEFTQASALSSFCCRKQGPEAVLKKELEYVQKEAAEKYEKLRLATDAHTGLEMLHLFVLDLLGRDTPAALIFSSKTSEDFRHAMIVSKSVKAACWVFIVLLNLFFVFFAMLRGMERGSEWQRGYAVACVIQFIVEIFMFETIECIWVHYLIPDAASAEIYAAQHSLKRTINSLCSTMSANATYILDAPKYLFVSTNLADKFPNMLESMIIRSYHYHMPGEMEKKWHVPPDRDSILIRFMRNFSIFAITISVLQWVGSSPSSLQRAVIHTVNPLLFGGIFILLLLLYRNPIYFSVLAAVIIYKMLQYAWRRYMAYRVENRPKKFDRMVSNVVPVPSNVADGTVARGDSAGSSRSINSISVVPLPTMDQTVEEDERESDEGYSYSEEESEQSQQDDAASEEHDSTAD